ncbi:MAG: hypothetical protein HW401_468 [Parcubacteria group bacterium]|nr:hypothetical protein [Parcubacteria group bacterium]
MRDINKRLEALGSFVKNVSIILSGVFSLIPWIKKLLYLIKELLQHYYWKHRLGQKGDVLFYEENYYTQKLMQRYKNNR